MTTATKEKPRQEVSDGWSPDDMVCITAGNGYCVTPTGATICIGPVDADGKPREEVFKPKKQVTETPPAPPETPPAPEKGVAKLPRDKSQGVNDSQIQNGGSFATSKIKHPGGRPEKEGTVHRTTLWRRGKKEEKQGVLL